MLCQLIRLYTQTTNHWRKKTYQSCNILEVLELTLFLFTLYNTYSILQVLRCHLGYTSGDINLRQSEEHRKVLRKKHKAQHTRRAVGSEHPADRHF